MIADLEDLHFSRLDALLNDSSWLVKSNKSFLEMIFSFFDFNHNFLVQIHMPSLSKCETTCIHPILCRDIQIHS